MDTTAAVVSQPRGDPHGNSSDVGDNLPNGGRGDGDARPAALKQGAEDKHRFVCLYLCDEQKEQPPQIDGYFYVHSRSRPYLNPP